MELANNLFYPSHSDLLGSGLDIPTELCLVSEWLANLDSQQTRRAYRADIRSSFEFLNVHAAEDLRSLSRTHILAWRIQLEKQGLSKATRRRKLAALASLFDYLMERDPRYTRNPVQGVKRPRVDSYEGKTPALSTTQAKVLLEAPDIQSAKGLRDRALLAILLYHGLRRQEVASLKISDIQQRAGLQHLLVQGKGGKTRFIPLHEDAAERLNLYLQTRKHLDRSSHLFTSLRGSKAGSCISADGIYKTVCSYAKSVGIEVEGLGVHGLRVTAATNALENQAVVVY